MSLAALALASSLGTAIESADPRLAPFVQDIDVEFALYESTETGARRHADLVARPTRPQESQMQHHTLVLAPSGDREEDVAQYETKSIAPEYAFRDLLPSWNVDCPEGTGIVFELRVDAGTSGDSAWSPWMRVGDWGVVPRDESTSSTVGGRVETDNFHGDQRFVRFALRCRAFARPGTPDRKIVVHRLRVCVSDPDTRVDPRGDGCQMPGPVPRTPRVRPLGRRLDVPFRSQKAESPEIASRICSPTSLAMVLAFRGVDRTTVQFVDRAYDADHRIYGNWPRNVQAAWSFGVPGSVRRFNTWEAVEDAIAANQPLICSIAAKPGELHGAPYEKTDGHLLVLTGFDVKGDCYVNDPAGVDAAHGQLVYARSEMQKVWLDRGGTAYVLEERVK